MNEIISKTIQVGVNKWIMVVDDLSKYDLGNRDGYYMVVLGKLDSQSWSARCQVFNKLLYQDWNFDNFPNPDLILFTKLLFNS